MKGRGTMFVFSVKTSKTQIFWALVCLVLIAGILLTMALWPDTAPTAAKPIAVASAEDGVTYLKTLGYDVTAGDVQEIQLPETLDGTLSAYMQLLKTAGVDITPFLGKRVKMRTFTVNDMAGVQIHLYTYKDKVIAGDITQNGIPAPLTSKQ
jgi:hypothetical protein